MCRGNLMSTAIFAASCPERNRASPVIEMWKWSVPAAMLATRAHQPVARLWVVEALTSKNSIAIYSPNARTRKAAIWPRVTLSDGQ
jgi:hypothetical protein